MKGYKYLSPKRTIMEPIIKHPLFDWYNRGELVLNPNEDGQVPPMMPSSLEGGLPSGGCHLLELFNAHI